MGGICFEPVEAVAVDEAANGTVNEEPQLELVGRVALPLEKPQDSNP